MSVICVFDPLALYFLSRAPSASLPHTPTHTDTHMYTNTHSYTHKHTQTVSLCLSLSLCFSLFLSLCLSVSFFLSLSLSIFLSLTLIYSMSADIIIFSRPMSFIATPLPLKKHCRGAHYKFFRCRAY